MLLKNTHIGSVQLSNESNIEVTVKCPEYMACRPYSDPDFVWILVNKVELQHMTDMSVTLQPEILSQDFDDLED
jgi:hypothetical protein